MCVCVNHRTTYGRCLTPSTTCPPPINLRCGARQQPPLPIEPSILVVILSPDARIKAECHPALLGMEPKLCVCLASTPSIPPAFLFLLSSIFETGTRIFQAGLKPNKWWRKPHRPASVSRVLGLSHYSGSTLNLRLNLNSPFFCL